MIANISEFHYALNFSINDIRFVMVFPRYMNCSKISKDLLYSYVVILSCILIRRHDHILSFLSIYFWTKLLASD